MADFADSAGDGYRAQYFAFKSIQMGIRKEFSNPVFVGNFYFNRACERCHGTHRAQKALGKRRINGAQNHQCFVYFVRYGDFQCCFGLCVWLRAHERGGIRDYLANAPQAQRKRKSSVLGCFDHEHYGRHHRLCFERYDDCACQVWRNVEGTRTFCGHFAGRIAPHCCCFCNRYRPRSALRRARYDVRNLRSDAQRVVF